MFTTIRLTTNSRNRFLNLLALVLLSVSSMGLSGCAGLVNGVPSKTGNPPTTLSITNATATSATLTGFQVDWTTNAPANSQVNYGKTSAYGATTGVNSTMVSSHQIPIASLFPGTTYHFQIHSMDASGNSATSADMLIATLPDAIPPTISIVSPVAGATISGNAVIISAVAADNVGVAGVQFKIDGASVGSAVPSAPYFYTVNTTTLSNGNHILTAVATDTSGNPSTSTAVTVVVNNTTKDTTPPTVSMTAPVNGATVSNTVVVSGTASDDVAVASVQFQLDNVNVGTLDTVAPYSFSWDSTKSTNGTHTLRAIATDTSSNSTTSASVSVTVNNAAKDSTPPTVSMTAPANGATVSNTVTVSANASDNVAVASVQFQLDNANVGAAATAAPYTFSWDTTKTTNGTHTLRAIATDTSNNSTTSASVSVTVNNATDTVPPTVPGGLTAAAASSSQINLAWTASSDNVGVTGYKVFRAGTQIGTSPNNTYSDAGLAASTIYTYRVSAYDAAGNNSAQSSAASATTQPASGGGLPASLGWYQIPNTSYAPLCPTGQQGSCAAVTTAWNSGVADTMRNRLMFMGGGHTDYSGNEIYALDLNALTMNRITNADPPNNSSTEVDPSGHPNTRHTYGGLSYIPSTDQMYMHGGALWSTGFGSIETWLFSTSSLTWAHKDPLSGTPVAGTCCNYITFGDYDPQTDLVWYTDSGFLWTYNAHANSQAKLSAVSASISDHQGCVVDYQARFFTCFGDSLVSRADMTAATPVLADITSKTSGCSTLVNPNTNPYPGLAYDPVQKKIVAWIGGSSVILFDSTALTCTTVSTYTGGPGAAQANGTSGRWRYFPALGVFALVNASNQNAWVLRMTATSGGSGPVISGATISSITTTSANTSWATNVPATSQVEYGTTTSYGSLTTLDSTLVTSHSQTLTGLTSGTVYHYRLHSANSSGVQTVSGDAVFSTNSSTDTTPPTISITSPASGATVTGTITVTANASDNVGVASVQFQLDGGNLGSVLTTTPYRVSWNTTTASNGAHTLTAKASDAAGNIGNATAVTVTVSNSVSSALQDFQNRCAAPGVIVCQGFDDPAGIPRAQNVGSGSSGAEPANDGVTFPTQDTSIAASGAGSVRFDIPVPSGPANPDGYWRQLMQSDLAAGPSTAQLFGQNSTFYVQFRQRMTLAYITNTWGGGTNWKQDIIAVDNSSCGAQEITTVNINNKGFPEMYSDCGALAFIVDLGSGDFLLEQGDTSSTGYNCHYQAPLVAPSNCFLYQPDVWMTFTYKIQVGTWGSPNSTIQAWATVNGQGYTGHEWTNMSNQTLNQDGGSVANGFNTVYLVPYWTGGYTGASGPATTWYDELIVSSQPIAAPNN